jgi:hypothetical protein
VNRLIRDICDGKVEPLTDLATEVKAACRLALINWFDSGFFGADMVSQKALQRLLGELFKPSWFGGALTIR